MRFHRYMSKLQNVGRKPLHSPAQHIVSFLPEFRPRAGHAVEVLRSCPKRIPTFITAVTGQLQLLVSRLMCVGAAAAGVKHPPASMATKLHASEQQPVSRAVSDAFDCCCRSEMQATTRPRRASLVWRTTATALAPTLPSTRSAHAEEA